MSDIRQFFSIKDRPVLRVEKGGWIVLGGFGFSFHDNKNGFTLDLFGHRVSVSVYLCKPYWRFKVSRLPVQTWIQWLIFWVVIGPAYSGRIRPELYDE